MTQPIVWTIAGADSGGGAGIQADIKVINRLGAHDCSVITALTAQNTIGTGRIDWTPPEMLTAQLEALRADLPAAAAKIGMLGNTATVETLAAFLKTAKIPFTVCDPVLISSSGAFLLDPKAWSLLKNKVFPAVDLITPNIPEAEHLLNMEIATPADIEAAALKALDTGVKEVLIKGGHGFHEEELSSDYWSNGTRHAWLSSPRVDTRHSHGTGCVLSSAIATARALGYGPLDSIILAKAYLNQGLRTAPGLGSGFGPLSFHTWEQAEEDLPLIAQKASEAGTRAAVPTKAP